MGKKGLALQGTVGERRAEVAVEGRREQWEGEGNTASRWVQGGGPGDAPIHPGTDETPLYSFQLFIFPCSASCGSFCKQLGMQEGSAARPSRALAK